ncbi:hypothetical protein STVIR_0771 [Streptomyces viridochromogenes Tue57]|uniref:Uncharacterized protein n=1 Tax=Streptomyces viridochromogenes Tue57 TaxID=1160705 RepID=L8PP04_STRVR|nr:hypothetical protein STVIR_0771 [Streptomyces viridochromogenes Tue57]
MRDHAKAAQQEHLTPTAPHPPSSVPSSVDYATLRHPRDLRLAASRHVDRRE